MEPAIIPKSEPYEEMYDEEAYSETSNIEQETEIIYTKKAE